MRATHPDQDSPEPEDRATTEGELLPLDVEDDRGDYTRTVSTIALPVGSEGEGDLVHVMTVVSGTCEGKLLEVGEKALLVGRRSDTDYHLPDPKISGRHCTLAVVMGQLLVTDLNSTNGTFTRGDRISGAVILPLGETVRVGDQVLRHDLRSRHELTNWNTLNQDLNKAAQYVRSLLPSPFASETVETTWHFVPCAQLGGDAFGYHWLDDDHFAIYLIDVCGHGVEAALHSVSAINLMRRASLPGTDFARPESVLAELGRFFVMEEHGNLYFTTWYGVYQASTRTLRYASAGHPPAFLVNDTLSRVQDLRTRNTPTGTTPERPILADETRVDAGERLYVFSDGAYEIETREGIAWQLEDLRALIVEHSKSADGHPSEIYKQVCAASASDLDDDFAMMALRFL